MKQEFQVERIFHNDGRGSSCYSIALENDGGCSSSWRTKKLNGPKITDATADLSIINLDELLVRRIFIHLRSLPFKY